MTFTDRKLNPLFSPELRATLLKLRRDLHRYPELSLQEEKTCARLYEELAALNPANLTKVGGTGLVARIKGQKSHAPLVAIRGDIDALPIHEQTGLDFSSQNDGVMHACGHDVHASWTVGAAHLLAQNPPEGDVLIILQPAEEVAKGACLILESGVLNEAKAIFGAHVDRRFEVGKVVAQEGPLAASADFFTIELTGQGSHGARPHEGNDPIIGMAALVHALQTIVSRRLEPGKAGVVSIGVVRAGTAANVIPETVFMEGTMRAVDAATREFLHQQVKEIANSVAAAYHLESNVKSVYGTPPIFNPVEPTKWARQAATYVLGESAVMPLGYTNMGGEDFSFYLEKIPGCFLRIGAREPDGEMIPAHSPYFYAADECIFTGAAVLAETARIASLALSHR